MATPKLAPQSPTRGEIRFLSAECEAMDSKLPTSGRRNQMGLIRDFIFLMLFFVLVVAWLIAWAAFHITGGMIHILLVIAVVSLIFHFIGGRRTA
jgi:hypothetical protein